MAFHEDYGNIVEFQKQLTVCQQLGLPTPFQVYKAWKPHELDIILKIREFAKENKPITVRQAYYQLKVLELVKEGDYHRVVRLLTKMRMSGIIPMEWIVDDTRHPEKTPSWETIGEIIDAAIDQYRSDWQIDQPIYIEVWLEKRTLRRIFYPITNHYDVYLCVGGGYQSLDMIRTAAERIKQRLEKGQKVIILYFGDLNPSGKDIPRDIVKRLSLLGVNVELKEIALTKQDITDFKLPRNPTAKKDARIKWFHEKYGIDYSVELDALPPQVLREKIERSIRGHLDLYKLSEHIERDKHDREQFHDFLVNEIWRLADY